MRITREAKARTRERIVEAARDRFADAGYDATTTRHLAERAGIATGTLFNYFPSKEALAVTILADAAEAGRAEHLSRRRPGIGLAEDLFGLLAGELRHFEPFRQWLGEALDAALTPFSDAGANGDVTRLREAHLEAVGDLLVEHLGAAPSAVQTHLYWTLYLGVLAFWSRDPSRHQEATLALLDQTLRMFVSALDDAHDRSEENDARHDS